MGKSVIQYYNAYDEEARLFRDYGHQIEWRTTMHYFRKVIPPGSRIFDGCAGTGRYAFQLAAEGHSVAASDLVPSYINLMGALPLYLAPGLENMEEIAEGYERRCFEEPFVYLLPEEMEEMAERYGLKILHHLTSDGNPYLRGEAFAGAKEEDFEKYMELHLKICENRNAVGGGLHGLVFLARR